MMSEQVPDKPNVGTTFEDTKAYLVKLRDAYEGVSIREFIYFWGAKSRGSNLVAAIKRDLSSMGLRTDPPFDVGPIDGTIRIESVVVEVEDYSDSESSRTQMLAISRINSTVKFIRGITDSENKILPGVVELNEDVGRAATIMISEGFSQLVVVESFESLHVAGVYSWETYGKAILRGGNVKVVRDAMEKSDAVGMNSDLISVMPVVSERGFVPVVEKGRLVGVLAISDLASKFEELSVPFLAVGRCELELKRVAKAVNMETPKNKDIDGLMFYALQQLYLNNWGLLNWQLDKDLFNEWMDGVRQLRNRVAHYQDQDGDFSAQLEAINRLTMWLKNTAPGVEFNIGRKVS